MARPIPRDAPVTMATRLSMAEPSECREVRHRAGILQKATE